MTRTTWLVYGFSFVFIMGLCAYFFHNKKEYTLQHVCIEGIAIGETSIKNPAITRGDGKICLWWIDEKNN